MGHDQWNGCNMGDAKVNQIAAYKETLIQTIKKHIPVCEIYLFGSRAMGTERPSSDIDIAIKTSSPIDRHILNLINEDIDALNIPFFVDIVDYNSVYDGMRAFMDKTGVLWSK